MIDFIRSINPDPVYLLRSYGTGGDEQFEGVFTSLHRAKRAAEARYHWQETVPLKWSKIRNERAWNAAYFGITETFLNKLYS